MKVALDTSVIVAAVVEAHPHHERAVWWLRGVAEDLDRVAAWHAYAEAWAVLTAIPIEPRISGEVAAAVLERVQRRVRFVPPRATTYPDAVARCNARSLRSGAVYDALHLITAEQQKAELLLTFNVADFTRIAEPEGPRIITPPDPPGMPPTI